MIRTTLEATNAREEIVRALLEDCISEELADKIDNGVWIEKDGQRLCNKKDLSGFMAYACEEAKKQAEKGANCACIDEDTLLGWAIHYFEEESIIGTLYTEGGDKYKPRRVETPKAEIKTATVAKTTDAQTSLFDLYDDIVPEKKEEPETDLEIKTEEENEPPLSPLCAQYMKYRECYPETVIVMRVGDFYEVFGEDSVTLSKELDLTLTSRDSGGEKRMPMIGFPYHRCDTYFNKIREMHDFTVIENENEHKSFTRNLYINKQTGEVLDEEPAAIQTLKAIFGDILEVRL